jgi:hypothetical protein
MFCTNFVILCTNFVRIVPECCQMHSSDWQAYGELGVGNLEWINHHLVQMDIADGSQRCRVVFDTVNGTFVDELCKLSPHNSNPHVQDRWGAWYTWWNIDNVHNHSEHENIDNVHNHSEHENINNVHSHSEHANGNIHTDDVASTMQLLRLTYSSEGPEVTPVSWVLTETKFHDTRLDTPYPESTARLAYDTETDVLFFSTVHDPLGAPIFNIPRLFWLNITASGPIATSYVDFGGGLYDLSKSVLTDNGKHFVMGNINALYGRTAYYIIPMKNILAHGAEINGTVIDLTTIETTHPELEAQIVAITFDTYTDLGAVPEADMHGNLYTSAAMVATEYSLYSVQRCQHCREQSHSMQPVNSQRPDANNACICQSGLYLNNNTCVDCEMGAFCTGVDNNLQQCPLAYPFSYQSVATSQDCKCAVGMKMDTDNVTCMACSVGTYCEFPDIEVSCPADSWSTAASSVITDCKCDDGFYGPLGGPCEVSEPFTFIKGACALLHFIIE